PVAEQGWGSSPLRLQPVIDELSDIVPMARIRPLRLCPPGSSIGGPGLLVPGWNGCGPRCIVFVCSPDSGHCAKSGGRSAVIVSSSFAAITRDVKESLTV